MTKSTSKRAGARKSAKQTTDTPVKQQPAGPEHTSLGEEVKDPAGESEQSGATEEFVPDGPGASPTASDPVTLAEDARVHKRNLSGEGVFARDMSELVKGSAADHSGLSALEVERSGQPDKAASLSNAVMAAAAAEPRVIPPSEEKAPTAAPLLERNEKWAYPKLTEAGIARTSGAELRAIASQRGYELEQAWGERSTRRLFTEAQEQDRRFHRR
jgi:hypothetical protein